MDDELLSGRIIDCLKGQTITSVSQSDVGSVVVEFDSGPTLFLYALPMGGGTLEVTVVENDDTDPEWVERYYGWTEKKGKKSK